jgi:hypothetical protein
MASVNAREQLASAGRRSDADKCRVSLSGGRLCLGLVCHPMVVRAVATWQIADVVMPPGKIVHRPSMRRVYRAVRHRLCPGLTGTRRSGEAGEGKNDERGSETAKRKHRTSSI